MAVVYANIGSNLGDRKALIEKALESIGGIFGFYCTSGFVESEAWGYDSPNRFLNIGVAFKTDLCPEEVLVGLQKIEKEISEVSHRDKLGNYADRELDIDIMAIDELLFNSPRLCLPHIHLRERDFFMVPLSELEPEWRDPRSGQLISELIVNSKK